MSDGKEAEIELARRSLEEDIEKRKRQAREDLDRMLSRKEMEFCSRCGKLVQSRSGWAGKCLWEGCDGLICRECREISKFRFCRKHAKGADEKEKKAVERKPVHEEHGDPDLKVDLKAIMDGHEETRQQKLEYYAAEYARWLGKRLEDKGPIDWTPRDCMKNPGMEREDAEGMHIFRMFTKRWFRRSVKLSIVVMPYDGRVESDMSTVSADVRRAAGRGGGHSLVALVSDGPSMELANFANRFEDGSISLYLVDPRNGHLNFNIREPVTTAYSEWLSTKREARRFRDRVASLGELVSGKRIVSEEKVAKEFGFSGKDAGHILGSCGFLKSVKDTGKYIVKDQQPKDYS